MFCQPTTFTGLQTYTIQPKKCTKFEAVIKRRERFKEQLRPYVEEFGKEMMNAFYAYWSELNLSKTKMRYEMEKVWTLNLRLARWAKNSKFESRKNGMPDKFDPVYETTLDEAGRLKYHNHLRSIGFQYVQSPGALGWCWRKIKN